MREPSPAPDDDQVDVDDDDFQRMLDSGEVGGGVTVEVNEAIGVVDGEEVRYLVDTSPQVADVLGQGIDAPPFGEEV